MGNYNFATIRICGSKKRAPEETERLFAGLELFVNTGESYEEYCDLVAKCPTFCPVAFHNFKTGENLGLLQNENLHQLTKTFRNDLVSVWRQHPDAIREHALEILLGLTRKRISHEPREAEGDQAEWPHWNASTPEALEEIEKMRNRVRENEKYEDEEKRSKSVLPETDPAYRRALFRIMHDPETRVYVPLWPRIMADWARGEFIYEPANDFQRAVYRLFRESWRARSCRQCQKLFIARKHPQMFCGVECSVIARRNRDLSFWKDRGATLRRKRKKQRRHNRG
jgi:hypothetical protein